jgi:hypothetical protein
MMSLMHMLEIVHGHIFRIRHSEINLEINVMQHTTLKRLVTLITR